jgi:hypothetical protein
VRLAPLRDPTECVSPCPHLKPETVPVSETLCFLVFRIPDNGQSPQIQLFRMLPPLCLSLYYSSSDCGTGTHRSTKVAYQKHQKMYSHWKLIYLYVNVISFRTYSVFNGNTSFGASGKLLLYSCGYQYHSLRNCNTKTVLYETRWQAGCLGSVTAAWIGAVSPKKKCLVTRIFVWLENWDKHCWPWTADISTIF